jgi:hypothetical protein
MNKAWDRLGILPPFILFLYFFMNLLAARQNCDSGSNGSAFFNAENLIAWPLQASQKIIFHC